MQAHFSDDPTVEHVRYQYTLGPTAPIVLITTHPVPANHLPGARRRRCSPGVRASRVAPVSYTHLDAIGRSRQGSVSVTGANDEREQTLDQILTEIDGFESSQAVIVLAATNRPDVLDPALLRAGRFDLSLIHI